MGETETLRGCRALPSLLPHAVITACILSACLAAQDVTPRNVQAELLEPSHDIKVTWEAPPDTDDVMGYVVIYYEYRTGHFERFDLAVSVMTMTLSDVVKDSKYEIRVAAKTRRFVQGMTASVFVKT